VGGVLAGSEHHVMWPEVHEVNLMKMKSGQELLTMYEEREEKRTMPMPMPM
jgi:hypothetical protein